MTGRYAVSMACEVTLYADKDRLLPHTDPFSRQIVIGLGCFLELMRMAAAEEKIGVQFDLFPDGADRTTLDQRRVATCRFAPGMATPDPLFAQVFKRRSLKEPYDTARPVSNEALAALRQIAQNGTVAGSTNAPEEVTDLRLLTFDALKTELLTPHTYKESVDLFRIGVVDMFLWQLADPRSLLGGYECMHLVDILAASRTEAEVVQASSILVEVPPLLALGRTAHKDPGAAPNAIDDPLGANQGLHSQEMAECLPEGNAPGRVVHGHLDVGNTIDFDAHKSLFRRVRTPEARANTSLPNAGV